MKQLTAALDPEWRQEIIADMRSGTAQASCGNARVKDCGNAG